MVYLLCVFLFLDEISWVGIQKIIYSFFFLKKKKKNGDYNSFGNVLSFSNAVHFGGLVLECCHLIMCVLQILCKHSSLSFRLSLPKET